MNSKTNAHTLQRQRWPRIPLIDALRVPRESAPQPGRVGPVALLSDIALALRDRDTVTGALQSVVARVCRYHDWSIGHAYRRDERGHWVPTAIWYPRDPAAFARFKQRTMETTLDRDVGLIGRAAQEGTPLWIDDVETDPSLTHRARTELQIRTAFLLPISVDGLVDTILEFYADRVLRPEARFIEATRTIDLLLGNLIRRRALESRVARAAEIERERIGAELHDTVGQQVAGIELLARTVQRNIERGGVPDPARVGKLVDAIGSLRSQVRELSREISVTSVSPLEFVDHLQRLAAHHQRAYGIECTCRVDVDPLVPTRTAATHLYRIAREAVHNAVTHGQPNRVSIALDVNHGEQELVLRVQDDGDGVQPASDEQEVTGVGLDIMRYRTSLLDGNLTLDSDVGGTTVVCSVPATSHLTRPDDE